jgi:hypothetical protein
MAYEFDLGDLEGPYIDSEGSQIVEFILGVDAETDTVAVMSVILFPTTQEDTLELCFGIRTKAGPELSRVSEPDYGKEGAEKYIPREKKSGCTCQDNGFCLKRCFCGDARLDCDGNILSRPASGGLKEAWLDRCQRDRLRVCCGGQFSG